MRKFMKNFKLILAVIVFSGISFGQTSKDVSFPYLGKIQPRHAKDIQSSNWSVGAETMDRDYTIYENWQKYLGPLGVKKARLQGGWAKTEFKRNVYNFEWLDEIIHDMVEQGVEPWMCLCYGNNLYSDAGGTLLNATLPVSDEAFAAWQKWVRLMVVRYQDMIDEWEVWNEPSNNKANTAEMYARLLVETAETVREIQPEATIIAMSLGHVRVWNTWFKEFTDQVLNILVQQNKLHLVDEITYHPYSYNPDTSYVIAEDMRRIIGKYNSRIKLRQGENGAPSQRSTVRALPDYDWSELKQAKWALRRLLGDLGRDIESSYFSMIDMKYPDEMNRKGLLFAGDDKTVDHPKQAYFAVQNLTAIFDNTLQRIEYYKFTKKTNRHLSLFGYENKYSGSQIVTVWNDERRPVESNKKTNVDFTFYTANFPEPVYVDLRTGEVFTIPEKNWSKNGSVYQFKRIPVYDSPILIADKSLLNL
jgi:hypothetical protein